MNEMSGLKGRVEDRSITIIAARRVRRLLDWGDPEAQPIVLLHSLGLDHELWRPVAARLRGRFRVIAPDIAGHGCERGDALMTNIAAAADDIARGELRQSLRGIKFFVIGFRKVGLECQGPQPNTCNF